MATPLISVVTTVYNEEKYLVQTIDSVLAQTLSDFEYILIDNGSLDGSAAIIRAYAARDPRVVPLFLTPNVGRCRALHHGISQASTEWISIIDGDDLMLPQRLARQYHFHRDRQPLDASTCHYNFIDPEGRPLSISRRYRLYSPPDPDGIVSPHEAVRITDMGLMISRRAFLELGGYREQFWPSEDVDLINRLLEGGYRVGVLPEVLISWRQFVPDYFEDRAPHLAQLTAWFEHCVRLRKAHQPEMTFEEYLNRKRADGRLRFYWEMKNHYAEGHYGRATVAWMMGKYPLFAWRLLLSLAHAPLRTSGRIVRFLTR